MLVNSSYWEKVVAGLVFSERVCCWLGVVIQLGVLGLLGWQQRDGVWSQYVAAVYKVGMEHSGYFLMKKSWWLGVPAAMMAGQGQLESFVTNSAKAGTHDKNEVWSLSQRQRRQAILQIKTRQETQEAKCSREQVRRVGMLSRFKLSIYYDIGQVFIGIRQCAQTKATKQGNKI